MKDWTGNSQSVYTAIGASHHSPVERQQHDYYATDPKAMELLLIEEAFAPKVWECACGEGHLSKVLVRHGYKVLSTDIVYHGYGYPASVDFLIEREESSFDGDIITNPPYKYALEFIEQSLKVIQPNHKVAMFLKLTFLEGQKRRRLFDSTPPRTVYVSSSRLICAKNGEFEEKKSKESAVAYAWFVWVKGYFGDSVIKWIN